ncbi:MAG TPA: prephenate dehydrogenase/arogenate dehydrogenase family protein [Planctomycetota bacterium]|nr:prephenate dehydrogenase/arogenate dehydrogenase family protein [Planctomycetota bacterium]
MAVFEKIAIMGLGLVGGAIGIAAMRHGSARAISGLVRHQELIPVAARLKACSQATVDAQEAVKDADLVILATGVQSIPTIAEDILPHMKSGAILTDVGSTKEKLVQTLEALCKKQKKVKVHYVGSHPIAGSEKRGLAYAQKVLLAGAICVMTPTDSSNADAVEKLGAFWSSLGMRVRTLDAAQHDRILARTSHVPHLAAAALMNLQTPEAAPFCGSGFKDMTRVAEGDADLWIEICAENPAAIAAALRELSAQLSKQAEWLEKGDLGSLKEHLATAQRRRIHGL